jgi:hypothetical protein
VKSNTAGLKGAIVFEQFQERRGHPKLKELVQEASRALAHLDAERLEELALSCQALTRDLLHSDQVPLETGARTALAAEAKDAVNDMVVFAKVIEATRANLNVMNRLRELRAGRLEDREGQLEYGQRQPREWRRTESGHGDN